MDDTCTALPRTQLEQFHTHLNSIEPSIDFTYELEDEGNLPFLDLNIKHHPDGTLSTNVFRKKTHTDKYLNFQSHHPLAHKLAVVRTLHNRGNTHCTFASDRVEESKRVCRALQLNGYPRRWSQHNRDVAPSLPKEREDQRIVVTIPYIRGVSESIRRVLGAVDIRTQFRPLTTLRNMLVQVKDPVPQGMKSGVVYQVGYQDCPATYVWQTARALSQRLKEHKSALTNGHPEKSAIAEHAMDTGHTIDWDNAQIMALMLKFYQRITLETWYMRSQPHGLNREEGVLPSVYNTLISGSRECVHRTAGTSNWLPGTCCLPICGRVTRAIFWTVVVYLCVCLYCIVVYTTEEEHRSVVKTFGVNKS